MSIAYALPATTLHDHHAAELYEASAIDPAIVDRRGYRSVTAADAQALGFAPSQCRPGLFLPTYTLAGVQVLGMLKPDQPRTDRDGKLLKYEWPAGEPPLIDIHPDALATFKTRGVEKWWTEGHKKADSAWSHGLACANLPGVYMFLHNRMIAADLDEIDLNDETSFVVFDSDVTRKQSVANAMLRFCEALRRRGSRVMVVYLPEGPNGAKVGLDDFLAAGGTVEQLRALAVRWDGKGPGIKLRTPDDVDPDEQAATIAYLIQAIQHPEHTRADLQVMATTAALTLHKRATGKATPEGRVILSAADIADDWRPAPEPGQPKTTTNPNGTLPRMARSTVKGHMQRAAARGLIAAEPVPINRTHANGAHYRDTDWSLPAVESLAALIEPWATFRPDEPKQRKPRTVTPPCANCGEVHAITRIGYCGSDEDPGCGAERDRRVIKPKTAEDAALDTLSHLNDEPELTPDDPEDAGDVDFTLDNLSQVVTASSPRPQLRIVTPFVQGTDHNTLQEPDWLQAAPVPWS
jgi:hypothetical protein